MLNIDRAHIRALYMEIGETMRADSSPSKLPDPLAIQLDRLRALDEASPSIVPSMN